MYDKLFINGQWVAPLSGKTFPVENPATEEVFHHIAAAGPEDANAAVNAAYAALKQWKTLTGTQRAVYLRNFAAKVQEKAKELARLETMDCGKPVAEAAWDMDDVAGCFTYYAELAEQLDARQGEQIKVPLDTFETRLFYEAAGVVTLIVPWNYPLLMAAWKVAPALAAGCTIVLKPSEFTSLTSLELAGIANEVGLPAGVFNVVTGTGADVGEPLTRHEKVAKIAFTGSTATGRRIMSSASAGLKGISLELGGKSPLLIFADSVTKADGSIDADEIDKVAEWVMFGCFWTNGQICSATSRLLVEESVAEPLMARVKILSEHWIKIGDPLLDDTKLGPLVNRQQYEKVLGYVESGKEQGATLLMGGKRPASQARGYFVEPTVFTNVRRDMRIWREEIFGPVLSVMTFKTEEEAVALANDSEYGLGSGVISKDADRCARIVRAMEAGIVWVNCSQPCFCQGPWGGVKLSGIGRDLGTYGLDKFLEVKQVTTYKSSDAWGWYVKSKL